MGRRGGGRRLGMSIPSADRLRPATPAWRAAARPGSRASQCADVAGPAPPATPARPGLTPPPSPPNTHAARPAAADDSAYVVRTYPFAAGAALLQLAATGLLRPLGFGTLAGIWWGLCLYYAVLLVAFGARCAWRAKRIDAAHPARPQD